MRRFLLVRHAESKLGARGLADGDPDRANALSETGREQAGKLRERLEDEPVDLGVTTRLQRTHETADLALEGPDAPRLVVAELDEIRFGRWEEQPFEQYAAWAWTAARRSVRRAGARAGKRSQRGSQPDGAACSNGPRRPALGRARPHRALHDRRAAGLVPAQHADPVALAEPYELTERELRAAVEALERWAQRPAWWSGEP